jgi:hypothetical protein
MENGRGMPASSADENGRMYGGFVLWVLLISRVARRNCRGGKENESKAFGKTDL